MHHLTNNEPLVNAQSNARKHTRNVEQRCRLLFWWLDEHDGVLLVLVIGNWFQGHRWHTAGTYTHTHMYMLDRMLDTFYYFRGKAIGTKGVFAGRAVSDIVRYALGEELSSSGTELLALAVDNPKLVGGNAVGRGVHLCSLDAQVQAGEDPGNDAKQAGVILDLHLQHLCRLALLLG